MNPEWFAGRLRELREGAGLTQEQLAERVGVKRDAVARWEGGRREPSWSNILALASALGVDCTAFHQEPKEMPKAMPGRPPKQTQEKRTPAPKKPKGRPRKSE